MFLKWIKVIDGVAGGINVAANKLFGKSLDNSLVYAYADDAANQLVPSEINGKFGHLGGVGEINAGAFKLGEFADK